MEILFLILGILLGILALVLLIAFISFLKVFYSPKRKLPEDDEYPLPPEKHTSHSTVF